MAKLTELGPVRARPGAISTGKWPIIELSDGSTVDIPVAIVRGLEDGPTLWILTGVHGIEYTGLGALQRLLKEIRLRELRGTLVAIPTVNILAYRMRQRSAYVDGLDMNRIWPGAPIAQAKHLTAHSEILVGRLIEPILKTADFAIDAHCGGTSTCAPYVGYLATNNDDLTKRARNAAVASGLRVIWVRGSDYLARQQNTSLYTLTTAGIPTLAMEAGGPANHEEGVRMMYAAFRGVMDSLGMLPADDKVPAPGEQIWVYEAAWVRAECSGFYAPAVPVLTRVTQGQTIASITDFFGNTRQDIVSPLNGIVITQHLSMPVNEGEFLCEIGKL